MKTLILLVVYVALLAYGQDQQDTCHSQTSEETCTAASSVAGTACNWCAEKRVCMALPCTKTVCCPLDVAFRPVICPDGVTTTTPTCNQETCEWTFTRCPEVSGVKPCDCSSTEVAIRASPPVLCADNSVVGPVCNQKTCAWEYPSCPGDCNGCINVPRTLEASFPCSDGSIAGQTCNEATCTWYRRECPADAEPVTCPGGGPILNCFAPPCQVTKCGVEGVKCVPDFCTCSAKFYDASGKEATCVAPVLPTCNADSCTGDKPNPTCANANVFCGLSRSDDSTSHDSTEATCQWQYVCPMEDSCENGCEGQMHPMTVVTCPDGSYSQWKCVPVTFPFTSDDTSTSAVRSCSWSSVCPKPSGDSTNSCVRKGICGEQCVSHDSDVSLPALNLDTCKASGTCEQKCSLINSAFGGCIHVNGLGCQSTHLPEYDECVQKCNGVKEDTSVCSGNICDCDYNNCFYCQTNFTAGDVTVTRGVCAAQRYGDACKVFSGVAFSRQPDQCTLKGSPIVVNPVAQALTKFDRDTAQTRLENALKTVANLDHTVVIQFALDAKANSTKDALARLLVFISSDASGKAPSAEALSQICAQLPKAFLDSTSYAGQVVFNKCNLVPVNDPSASAAKRSFLQTTTTETYMATMGTDPSDSNTNNSSGGSDASALILSMTALFVAAVVNVF